VRIYSKFRTENVSTSYVVALIVSKIQSGSEPFMEFHIMLLLKVTGY